MATREELGFSEACADITLIDARACAVIGSMSVSWWHAEVAAGRAPQPAIRRPRCTRWRLTDVRIFWQRASEAPADVRVVTQAVKASEAARAMRKGAGK